MERLVQALVESFKFIKKANDNPDRFNGLSPIDADRLRHREECERTGWKFTETPHFFIKYDVDKEDFIKEIKEKIEGVRKEYVKYYGDFDMTEIPVLRIVKNSKEYAEYGGHGGGQWSSATKELIVPCYKETDQKQTWIVLNHEGFHQFIYYKCGKVDPHSWYNEGTGDYYGGYRLMNGKFELKPLGSWAGGFDRVTYITEGIKKGTYVPLEEDLPLVAVRVLQRRRDSPLFGGLVDRLLPSRSQENGSQSLEARVVEHPAGVRARALRDQGSIEGHRVGAEGREGGQDEGARGFLEGLLPDQAQVRGGAEARPRPESVSSRILTMCMTRKLASAALVVLGLAFVAAPAALADRIVTKSGRVLEGKVTKKDDNTYHIKLNTTEFDMSVESIKEVLVEGDMSGYVPKDDKEKEFLAKGLVKYNGQWISKDQYQQNLDKENAKRRKLLDEEAKHLQFATGWKFETAHFQIQGNCPRGQP